MHLCRFVVDEGGGARIGLVDRSSDTVTPVDVDISRTETLLRDGIDPAALRDASEAESYPLDVVDLLAPIERPTNLVGIGLNYTGHAEEGGFDIPDEPIFFAKSPSSITDPGSDIVRHNGVTNLHYEGEFGVVIGETASRVDEDEATDCVFGYTIANDVTARDMQGADIDASNPWYRSKSMDTFTPLGPWIATADELDPANTPIETRLNGDPVQSASTSELIFSVSEAISYVSQYITLQPGDVVITGTPAGVGEMGTGDDIVVDVDSIGSLENQVIEP